MELLDILSLSLFVEEIVRQARGSGQGQCLAEAKRKENRGHQPPKVKVSFLGPRMGTFRR
jgi:hypothetical protein